MFKLQLFYPKFKITTHVYGNMTKYLNLLVSNGKQMEVTFEKDIF